jgi:hypothetical protein
MSDETLQEHLDESVMGLPEFERTQGRLGLLTNQVYDIIKNVVIIVIPALSTFYLTIAKLWGLPGAEAVVGTLGAVALLLGSLLKLSKRSYDVSDEKYDGEIILKTTEQGRVVQRVEANGTFDEIAAKGEVLYKVVQE